MLSLNDVFREFWIQNPDVRYKLDDTRISCKSCGVIWMRVYGDKIEYALEANGVQLYMSPSDPDLFDKMLVILDQVSHDPDYKCYLTY